MASFYQSYIASGPRLGSTGLKLPIIWYMEKNSYHMHKEAKILTNIKKEKKEKSFSKVVANISTLSSTGKPGSILPNFFLQS